MAEADPIKYRDPEAEKAVVQILEDPTARESFLRDRQGFLQQFNIPAAAKEALLAIPDDQVTGVATEYDYNFRRGADVQGYSKSEPTLCTKSTFGDFFCDG